MSAVINPVNASEKSKHCQSSQESFAHWVLDVALIYKENDSDNCVSRDNWLYGWEGVVGVVIEHYGRMLKKGWIIYHIWVITCIESF